MNISKEQQDKYVQVLKECYEIYGDGVARAKFDVIVKRPEFQENLRKLAELKMPFVGD